MTYTARARRTSAVLAALSLGVLALTACDGGTDKDTAGASTATPSATDPTTAAPSATAPGKEASPSGGSDDADGASPSSEPGVDDGQDGGVGMCETSDLDYTVTVASLPFSHALLTATNNSGDPCLLPADDPVITIPGLDGAAEHRGPTGTDWILEAGGRAYAGILFDAADTTGGKTADQVEIALTAAESPATVTIDDGPVTVDDSQVTGFFGTAEDALSY
ncbi:DUF4232 domain-containing protein [Streptomyces phaeolivaceus]|uniref:DUF4232 domain-containing protein n=1 Tax=Streptomyces phaeolivaceus TaxID=2653200 RepID=A0A5P8KG10_9ACTN|nr:DUF4232 domain-containing protein [Streptomyces phaeolivaceus]QFR02082.1 DUF4232 domain-containing protein [Streptomyces phaeolivaceus]